MRYKCIEDFYIEKFDDDGFSTGKYSCIPKDSIWEKDNGTYRFVGADDTIRLFRIWKTKKAKTSSWIEITKETFNRYFEQLKAGSRK